jgi:hypothetical protein
VYGDDILAGPRRRSEPTPELEAAVGLVVEERASGFTGEVVAVEKGSVTLRDRFDRDRHFPLTPRAFAVDGRPVTLVRPAGSPAAGAPRRTASGSLAPAAAGPAKVALPSRIYVEGVHDAALVEKVWGDDLREVGVAVEYLEGIDDLGAIVRGFDPGPTRRLGVLVDHLVAGSKESRIVAGIDHPHVLVTGHPYVDVWQAVRPRAVGIEAWPVIPKGQPWKEGICAALGVSDPATMWRRILGSVRTYADLETPLVGAVEELIDFVTDP